MTAARKPCGKGFAGVSGGSRRLFRRCYPRQNSGIYRRREDDYDGGLIASDFLVADSGEARNI
jgi:hypothetical protein